MLNRNIRMEAGRSLVDESYPLDGTELIRIHLSDGTVIDVPEKEILAFIDEKDLNIEVYTDRGRYLGHSPYTGEEWEENECVVATDVAEYLDNNWEEVIDKYVKNKQK